MEGVRMDKRRGSERAVVHLTGVVGRNLLSPQSG